MTTPASSYVLLILLPMYLIEINNLNLFFYGLNKQNVFNIQTFHNIYQNRVGIFKL